MSLDKKYLAKSHTNYYDMHFSKCQSIMEFYREFRNKLKETEVKKQAIKDHIDELNAKISVTEELEKSKKFTDEIKVLNGQIKELDMVYKLDIGKIIQMKLDKVLGEKEILEKAGQEYTEFQNMIRQELKNKEIEVKELRYELNNHPYIKFSTLTNQIKKIIRDNTN